MSEAIAIIGMGCRFPKAEGLDGFWKLLKNGEDAIAQVPASRWDRDAFYDPKPATPGKMNTLWGGFLEAIDEFDPEFFGISPREAHEMDPQQRLVLEVAWEALENACIVPKHLAGRPVGVFIGISNVDYRLLGEYNLPGIGAYGAIGQAHSMAANRLSYFLDLRGPSMAVDTACSSSLVTVHLACQSLLSGESDLAIAGGVNVLLLPGDSIVLSQAKMMAPDGRCKTFDSGANGYVRGEGCGIVILKRLAAAVRDKDPICGVIRGSAVNQNGLTNGLTAPSGLAQQAVIRRALDSGAVAPDEISYVEVHSTGTSLGDPIEVAALKAVLMEGRASDQRCWLGSVKTNIGHLETAAGIAGLIKVVLSLQHQQILPSLHLQQLNPRIKLDDSPLAIATWLQQWPQGKARRLAGVSAFSYGGSNAHVIVEEAPTMAVQPAEIGDRPHDLFTISARSEPALHELVKHYIEFLQVSPDISLGDLCFTQNTGRTHFSHRLASVVDSIAHLEQCLSAWVAGQENCGLVGGKVLPRKRWKVVFLFTGLGSQYEGMGQQLYETQPVFRSAINRCAEILAPELEMPLLKVLYPSKLPEGASARSCPLDRTVYSLPALFALEYALYQLWQSWGIQPAAVMGDGVGEYVAACVAGVFSLEDGLKLIASLGQMVQELPDGEVMASFEQVAQQVSYYPPQIQLMDNITGQVGTVEVASPEYWCQHTLSATNFAAGMETLHQQGYKVFLECGPQPILLDMGRQCWPDDVGVWLPSLKPGQSDWQQMLVSLGELYVRGVKVNWLGFDRDYRQRRKVTLPTYPWQRQSYWLEDPINSSLNGALGLAASWRAQKPLVVEARQPVARQSRVVQQSIAPQPQSKTTSDPHSHEAIVEWVEQWFRRQPGIDAGAIDPRVPFANYGMKSVLAVKLMQALEDWLQIRLDATLLWNFPTMDALAEYLVKEVSSAATLAEPTVGKPIHTPGFVYGFAGSSSQESSSACLVPLQYQGERPPFFCVHPYAGVVFPYVELAHLLGNNQPFYGLQALGLNPGETPLTSISDMAAAYVRALKTVQSQGPYRVGGWSMGAWIAFEMAWQLQQEGDIVDRLVLIDMPPPHTSYLKKLLSGVPFLFGQVLPEILPYVADYLRLHLQPDNGTITTPDDRPLFPTVIVQRMRRISSVIASSAPLASVLRANTQAVVGYSPNSYDGEITLLRTYRSVGGNLAQELTLGWQQFSSQAVQVHFLPGRHLTLLRSPHVQQLAETLQTCLLEPQ